MSRVSMGEGINLSLDQESSAFVTSSLMPIVYNLLLELEKQRSIQNICFLALDLTPMIQAKPKICQKFSLQVMDFISYQMIISLLLLISSNLLTYHFSSISSISPFPCSSKEQDDSNASTLTLSLPRPHVSPTLVGWGTLPTLARTLSTPLSCGTLSKMGGPRGGGLPRFHHWWGPCIEEEWEDKEFRHICCSHEGEGCYHCVHDHEPQWPI